VPLTTFNGHIEAFIDYLLKNKRMSVHTCEAYLHDLKQFDVSLNSIGNPPLDKLSSLHIRNWISNLMEEGISARSVNRKLSSLRSYLRYLRSHGLLNHDPMSKVVAPKTPKHLVKDIPLADLKSMFDRFPWHETENGLRDQLILLMLYTTGMRLSELIYIKRSDIDFDRKELRVLGKRNKVRALPMHDELAEALKKYFVLSGGMYVFERKPGVPFYPVFVYRLVNHYLRLFSHASKTSPHVLRHSFATHMLNNGANLMAIKDLLGHSSLSATQVYTKNSFEKLKKIHALHPRK
jgi:integrase/recombinase XerC